jgi:hypothetical protein
MYSSRLGWMEHQALGSIIRSRRRHYPLLTQSGSQKKEFSEARRKGRSAYAVVRNIEDVGQPLAFDQAKEACGPFR